nr:protein phosphatase 1 regulatory subunit 26 isoform X2 [Caretta caretta]
MYNRDPPAIRHLQPRPQRTLGGGRVGRAGATHSPACAAAPPAGGPGPGPGPGPYPPLRPARPPPPPAEPCGACPPLPGGRGGSAARRPPLHQLGGQRPEQAGAAPRSPSAPSPGPRGRGISFRKVKFNVPGHSRARKVPWHCSWDIYFAVIGLFSCCSQILLPRMDERPA